MNLSIKNATFIPIIPYPAMAGSAWPNIGPYGARYVNWMWWNGAFQLSQVTAGFEGDRSSMDQSLPSYRMLKQKQEFSL